MRSHDLQQVEGSPPAWSTSSGRLPSHGGAVGMQTNRAAEEKVQDADGLMGGERSLFADVECQGVPKSECNLDFNGLSRLGGMANSRNFNDIEV